MRLDLFLKTSRIIKRRALAKELTAAGRIAVDGRPGKSSTPIRPGQEITIDWDRRAVTYRVVRVPLRPSGTEPAEPLVELIKEVDSR